MRILYWTLGVMAIGEATLDLSIAQGYTVPAQMTPGLAMLNALVMVILAWLLIRVAVKTP